MLLYSFFFAHAPSPCSCKMPRYKEDKNFWLYLLQLLVLFFSSLVRMINIYFWKKVTQLNRNWKIVLCETVWFCWNGNFFQVRLDKSEVFQSLTRQYDFLRVETLGVAAQGSFHYQTFSTVKSDERVLLLDDADVDINAKLHLRTHLFRTRLKFVIYLFSFFNNYVYYLHILVPGLISDEDLLNTRFLYCKYLTCQNSQLLK